MVNLEEYLIKHGVEECDGYKSADIWIDECLNLNNKEDEMKGKVADVELRLVEVINGKLVNKTIFESSVQEIIKDERVVVAGGMTYNNVYDLEIDGEVEFVKIYPTIKVIDNRFKLAKLKGKRETLALMKSEGVISKEDFDVKWAKLNKKMEGLSESVEYELVWEGK